MPEITGLKHLTVDGFQFAHATANWETVAIKFHNTVDATIRHNLIRCVYHQQQAAYGIWIDYANQGLRITGNLIYDTQTAAIFLEMNHGGMLIDNNVLLGY